MEDRNKKAVEKVRMQQKEKRYGNELLKAAKKNDYIKNTLNGRYFLERYNMIVEQVNSGNIVEKIDGQVKTKEYILSEGALMKFHAIESFRNAFFAKEQLIKDFKMTEEDLTAVEDDYFNGKIIRDTYDETKPRSKAEFVNTSED